MTITAHSIRNAKLAAWYEQQARELRASGDCDAWNLAADYDQLAADLRGNS